MTEPSFEDAAADVDQAIARVDELDDDSQAAALALKDAIEAFHRPALVTIVRSLKDDPAGKALLMALATEPEVHAVLSLHGIIRADPVTRANQALDQIRPYLDSHGGGVQLIAIEPETGIAQVRLTGSCQGCSMSAETLANLVDEALLAVD